MVAFQNLRVLALHLVPGSETDKPERTTRKAETLGTTYESIHNSISVSWKTPLLEFSLFFLHYCLNSLAAK